MDVVIVGGGIVGCSIGLRLAQKGAQVTILERSVPGAEASSAAAGILGAQAESVGPGAFLDLCLASRDLYAAYVEEVEALAQAPVGYQRCGLLHVTLQESGVPALEATVAWQRARGLQAQLLSRAEVLSLEPSLSPRVKAAASFPDDHQVDNRLLVPALTRAAGKAGARFLRGQVLGIEQAGGRASGVRLERELVHADAVVVAAGSWTSLVPGTGVGKHVVVPRRGQMAQLTPPTAVLRHVVFGDAGYLVPRSDGRVILGSTMEAAGFDKSVTAGGVSAILARALEACPALEGAVLSEVWAGLRPETADGLPILGPGPFPGLFLASGHFRNGILLAPVTADAMSDVVLGRIPRFDLGPFRLERAALRGSSEYSRGTL